MASRDEPIDMHWHAESPAFQVWFSRDVVETSLRQLLGYLPDRRLRFDLGLDLTEANVRGWLELVRGVRRAVEHRSAAVTHPAAQRPLAHMLASSLLLCARHTYSDQVDSDHRPAPPPIVRRAIDVMHDHAAERMTVGDIAEALGIGVRTLQEGFRSHLGTTPSAYLRQVRLDGAHAELAAASAASGTTVTDVAIRWGFLNPGRFAQAYHRAYGERPSATLRR